jgi:hypothetical protein
MTPRPLTPAEINAQQKRDAEQETLALQTRQNEAHSRALAVSPSTPAALTPPATSPEAFEHNLASWSSTGGTPLVFNALEGVYQRSSGDTVDVRKTVFAAHLDETRFEKLRFNGEGSPPTLISVGIYEDAALPSREELGDTDPALWEKSRFTGEPVDPWQDQFRTPIVAQDDGGEIFELTSRSKTSMFAFRSLLNRYARHPQRKKGLIPLVTLSVGSYHNSKLGQDKPKPVFQIIGWVNKDGSAPEKKPNLITSGGKPFNDEVPFS